MENYNSLHASGMILMTLVCIFWFFQLFTADDPWILLDNANFIIHEAGHIVFLPFGEFLMMLGGTLMQLIVPIGIGIYFGYKRMLFSAGFCIFWVGDNLVNIARYIADARARALPLIGTRHDWNWLLPKFGLLRHDKLVGQIVENIGHVTMVIGIVMMIFITYLLIKKLTGKY